MITRASPYGFGMLAATLFHMNKWRDFLKETNIVLEWIAFLVLMIIGWVGPNLPEDYTEIAQIKFLWLICIARSLYGAVLAYLILLCVSADTVVNPIPWYRPTRWIRAFLCLDIWLPIATVSYSMYIWHLILIQKLFPVLAGVIGLQDEAKNGFKEWHPKYAGWLFLSMLIVFIPTMILSILSYIFIEKASIDARRVFKNKYA
jgi:peptidoglycan/LPS O-acetylase OafA/YrhL